MGIIMSGTSTKSPSAKGGQTILGNLVFTSIGDLRIYKHDLESMFVANNLSLQTYMPADIRPSDAMRRATSKLKGKKIQIKYNMADTHAVIDVVESLIPNGAVRYVGRKVIDEFMQTVNYESVSTFLFDRTTSLLTHTPVDSSLLGEYDYEVMLQDTHTLYSEYCNYHNKETIRNIILRIINSCMPTLIKPVADEDSVAKFIPHSFTPTLTSMSRIIKELNSYSIDNQLSGCQFIELFDSEANKNMIEQCLKNDVKTKVINLVSDMADILNARGVITLEKGRSIVTQLKSIKNEVQHYSDMLGTSMEVLNAQIQTALQRVELPENYAIGEAYGQEVSKDSVSS